MEPAFRPPALGRVRWPLLGGGAAAALAGVLVAWAAANTAPTITGAAGLEVRPDRSVAVSLSATDADADPDDAALSEAVRLQAVAPAGAPAWLDDSGWSVPAAPDPTLAFEIAAPETAAPAAYVISAMATDGRGLSSTSQFELRVLAPLCPAPLEVDDGGTCAACPDHHLPNVAKTRCVACPADTERAGGTGSCTACPRGELSAGGETCAPNGAPHADAGPDLTAEPGRRVVLDGTGSSDPEGRPLAYAWSQREGPDVALTRGATARPRFPAPRAAAETLLRFRLKVTDPQGRSDTDWVRVTVQPANRPPTADAGPDQSVDEGGTATLDGTASADEDGDALTYAWTAPPGVTLSDAAAAKPTFTAPNRASPYSLEFALTVDDGAAESAPDRVTVSVDADNDAPTALAGRNRAVESGDAVTLAGGGTDPEGEALTYRWEQRDGPAVDVADATSAVASFTAPPVDARTALTFRLTVSDPHGARSRVSIRINVRPRRNAAPVANAGSDQAVDEGATVGLDGTASSDGDDDALTYAWTAPEGVALPDPAAARPTFTAPDRTADYKLTFTLTVNDGTEDSYPDTVMVAVAADDDAPEVDAGRNRTVESGESVTLSGGGADPEGLAVTYAWVQRGGSEVELGGAKEATATFDAPRVDRRERLSFRLKVTDPGGNTGRDDVRVNVLPAANAPPVASASAVDARIGEGATGTLDGSASSDAEDDPLTYSWTAPPGVALSDAAAVRPTFEAPNRKSDYSLTFTLTVNDGKADSAADAATVSVTADDDAPTADAGADVAAKGGDRVALDGTGSSDPEGGPLTHAWTQTAGPAVALSDTTSARPSFAAPVAGAALAFSLVVNDGASDSAADAVGVAVAPAPRVALSLGSSSIAEDGGSTTVTASLPEAARRAFEVTVSESSPALVLGGNATLAFAAGATAGTGAVTLSAVDDDVHTGNRTATVAGALSDGAPAQAPAPVALTVADDEEDGAPDFGGAAVPDQAWAKDAAIAALTLPTADGGDGEVTYGLSPALPTGLSFDPAARRISGTPKARQAPTPYTYTATDADGDPDSLTFRIAVDYWRLTVSPKPAGGTVTGRGGISCGSAGDACSATVEGGGATLTATADAGYGLESWSGACAAATGTSCALTLSAATTAGASFGELPACNASATGPGNACGAGAYGLLSWSGAHGACGAGGTPGCGAGRMESHAPPPAAACGSSADSCASGDWRDGTDTAAERRWSCAGETATETWTCAGSGGDWIWTCTGGGETKSCAGTLDGSSAGCSRQSAGADASCFACRDGHHGHDGSCHADHACGDDEIGGGDRACVPCPAGKVPNADRTACGCPSGEHEHGDHACHAAGNCHGDGDCGDGDVCWNGSCGTRVDGGWTAKSHGDWGSCPATACGESGRQSRSWTRTCTNPAPAFGGADCSGEANGTESRNCAGDSCAGGKVCWSGACETPVDGGWTAKSHGDWGNCSATACGSTGTRERSWSRTCTNPAPAFGGADCSGEANGSESRNCAGDSCAGGKVCWSGACETPVDGGWTAKAHGDWGNCSATACGSSGTRERSWSRSCTNPAPAFGGADCSGEANGTESRNCAGDSCAGGKVCWSGACETPVDGGWTAKAHGDWDNCSATACGSPGTRERSWSRSCTNPAPAFGGADCSGEANGTESRNCAGDSCAGGKVCWSGACETPVDGGWTDPAYGEWGNCSATECGSSGTRTRTWSRTCSDPAPAFGGRGCDGQADGTERGNCKGDSCAGGKVCWGGSCETPVDGGWTEKSYAWSGVCSATACGSSGTESGSWTRSCTNPTPAFGGADCSGEANGTESRNCEGDSCAGGKVCWSGSCETPVDGGWTEKSYAWSGVCSATACGSSGTESGSWTRSCTNPTPAFGGADCSGEANGTESRNCEGDSCAGGKVCWSGSCETPVDGGWTEKSYAWSGVCSATACGSSGTESGSWTRSCTNPMPAFGGADCSGEANGTESRNCEGDSCAGGKVCWGGSCETPVDGGWTEKSYAWSGVCSATACGSSGTESGSWTRSCTNPMPAFGGADCSGEANGTEGRNCEGDSCAGGKVCWGGSCETPVDGGWADRTYGEWGNCSATACGSSGTRTRTWSRTCSDPAPAFGGSDCVGDEDGTQTETCYGHSCVSGQHCNGSGASAACHADHVCGPNQIGGGVEECEDCPEGKTANTGATACVCTVGKHEHGNHQCHPEGDCHDDSECPDGKSCWEGSCCTRVDGGWSDRTNGTFGSCSATACGSEGTRTRTWSRTCTNPAPSCGGASCVGRAGGTDERSCHGGSCAAGQHCDGSGGSASCHADHVCGPDQIGGGGEECTTCPDGQVPNTTRTACEACQFGESQAGTCRTCPTGCSASSCGGANVCQCPGSSCPQLWGQHGNCTATQAKTCSGDTDGCGRKRYSNRCTTGSHTFGNVATESCLYEHRDRDLWRCQHWTRTCRAKVTQVGCVYTGVVIIPPIDLPFPVASPPDGGYERGYLLAPFQCGSAPDTCRVEIGDEVLEGSEGVEERDDADTEHRWACRSDTGELRECSAEKE